MDDSPIVSRIQKKPRTEIQPKEARKTLLVKFAPLILGLIIAIAVCAPFFRGGYLLLLDWVIGPHTPIISPSFYGLQGGINASFLFSIAVGILDHFLGSSVTWVPIFVFFPLACISIARAIKGNLVAKLAAGLFFSINPFVVERIYAGQLGAVYGYLLLPVLYVAVDKWTRREVKTVTHIALIITLMISIDVHYAWIGGLIVLVGIVLGIKDNAFRRSIPLLLLLIILLNIYLVIPVLGHPLPVNPADNQTLLKAFSTRGDPRLGLFANVLGLYGFWRQMHESSKSLVSGWPILLVAILLLSLYGLKTLWDRNDKKLALLIAISFVAAYLLALGSQGPTGPFFTLLYNHMPGFSMMREPEKFSAILATGISILLGEGLANISLQQTSRNAAIAIIAVGAILELSYNPIIFWGIHGQVQTSKLPSDWATVANKLKGTQGKTLVLPWHQYLSFPFTDKRIITNPGPRFLPGDIISGDNLQIGAVYTTSTSQRSAYITWLTQNKYNTRNFGRLLAPIGVQYIVLYKTYSTGSSSWITRQKDLAVIYSSQDIEIVKNMDFSGLAQILPHLPTNNLNALLVESNNHQSYPATNTLSNIIQNPVRIVPSSTNISFIASKTGWLNLDKLYFSGWHLNNQPARANVFGTQLYRIKTTRINQTVNFSSLDRTIYGYLLSGFMLLSSITPILFPNNIAAIATRKGKNISKT